MVADLAREQAMQSAGDALYRVVFNRPCTCLKAGLWPFRSKDIVEGKPVDKPDVICSQCKAMRAWEALAVAGGSHG